MNKNIYKVNRDNLLNKIKDNSIVILFAGKAIQKTGDQTYPFTPNRNFYYLTGIKEEEHILVMSKINGIKSSKLYIKDIDLELEKWIGKSIRKEEAIELTAVDEVKFKSKFGSHSSFVAGRTFQCSEAGFEVEIVDSKKSIFKMHLKSIL